MKIKFNHKVGVNTAIMVLVGIGLVAINIALFAYVLGAFSSAMPEGSISQNITNDGLALLSGITSQFSTIGQISGVLILITVLGLFGFGAWTVYQKTRGGNR